MIVGAGQSGLHLAHTLLDHGYDTTIVTAQSSTEIRTGRPSATQLTMPRVLEMERAARLDRWRDQAPRYTGARLSLRPQGASPIEFTGTFTTGYGVSVDRRMKMADWLEHFEDRGGKVTIHGVTVSDLDYFTRMYDLIIVAVGAGELGALFGPDPTRSGGAHEGVLTQALLTGVAPPEGTGEQGLGEAISLGPREAADGGLLPGGEVFIVPILCADGPATSVFVKGRPGSALDCGPDIGGRATEQEILDALMGRLREHVPDVAARCEGAALVDDRAASIDRIVPQVRRPVGVLPSGGRVLGMADVVLSSDPISGQGWNNSTLCADAYLHAITYRGEAPFTEEWMEQTFDAFWEDTGRHAAVFSEMVTGFWANSLPDHFPELIEAVVAHPEVRDRWITGFDRPDDYEKWMFDPAKARAYISRFG
nr:styrene monooxygenase/indole monooxygenase family protein [Nocardiopsis mwathae]